MKPFLAFTEALYLKPLLYGVDGDDSPFRPVVDFPAAIAMNMSKPARTAQSGGRTKLEGAGCAFLSPIDYARYGAEYCIVPTVAVSSSQPTDTIELYVKPDIRNIKTMAVDIRITSEIILAKIILTEKYPYSQNDEANLQIVPMMPNLDAMLSKADAALLVNFAPTTERQRDVFKLDLIEEWYDLTDLPYVHGFWVGRQDEMLIADVQRLIHAKKNGVALLEEVAAQAAKERGFSAESATQYLSAFSYDFTEQQSESLQELMSYAYYFGVLPDIPEINFFDVEDPSKLNSN